MEKIKIIFCKSCEFIEKHAPIILALIIFISFFIAIRFYSSQFPIRFSTKQDVWGAFGDYIGGLLNPLIAFSAFVLVWLTLRVQKEELRKTSKALREQSETLEHQNFDNHFFQLLQFHYSIIDSNFSKSRGNSKSGVYYELWPRRK